MKCTNWTSSGNTSFLKMTQDPSVLRLISLRSVFLIKAEDRRKNNEVYNKSVGFEYPFSGYWEERLNGHLPAKNPLWKWHSLNSY